MTEREKKLRVIEDKCDEFRKFLTPQRIEEFIQHALTLSKEDKYDELRKFLAAQPTGYVGFHANDSNGWTLLHHAADNGDCGLVSILVNEYNVYVLMEDNDGYTPLMFAATQGFTEICEILVEGEIEYKKRCAQNKQRRKK